MKYSLEKSTEILDNTPKVLYALLTGLSDEWILSNEGADTFSPYDVVGHLIHGEKGDWRNRIEMILTHGTAKTFDKFDRMAQYTDSAGKTIQQLLEQFEELRKENMHWFKSLEISEADLEKKGLHPALGEVTLRNLLATWVAHDLTHIAQITRVMAKQYKNEMGPWQEFFKILAS